MQPESSKSSANASPPALVAFYGHKRVAKGPLPKVIRKCKKIVDEGLTQRLAIFDAQSGRAFDVEFEGTEAEVQARAEATARPAPSRGRPKLGVVCKEVSLLPEHWEWLGAQRGGASATLRRLVLEAKRKSAGSDAARRAIDAAHRFLWDLAGDLPAFEDVTRALYRGEREQVNALVADWPKDIRDQLALYLEAADKEGAAASS